MKLLNVREVSKMLGVSPATVWRMAKRGQIPQPRKVSLRSTRWEEEGLKEAVNNMPRSA